MAGTRIPQDEYDDRVKQCYTFRFENKYPFTVKNWIEYCKEHYPDKSGLMYTKMWADAGQLHEEGWRELLNKQLTPASQELIRLLADENPKIRHEAAKSIFKYTGNEINKQEITGTVDVINVRFTDE
jgi:hypothetical protein